MKLTSKGRYAVTAMLDVALHTDAGPVPLADISQRQEISLSYLEQLFLKLRKAGIVKSFRGSSGGYAIAKSPDLIRITEILKAVDQDLDLGSEKGSILNKSKTKEDILSSKMWEQLSANIYVFLHQMRLSDITADQLNPCPAVPNFVTISDN